MWVEEKGKKVICRLDKEVLSLEKILSKCL